MECWVSILTVTFSTTRMAECSAWCAGHTLPLRKSFVTNFCNGLSRSKGYWMQSQWLGHLKISKEPTRNWTWKILSLAQTTVPPLAPKNIYVNGITHWAIHLGIDKSTAFDVHVTVHRVKFLIIKPNRCTTFSNLSLKWNSTCFGQFLCPSSGVFHCTHNNGVCHRGLLTACEQDQNGTTD